MERSEANDRHINQTQRQHLLGNVKSVTGFCGAEGNSLAYQGPGFCYQYLPEQTTKWMLFATMNKHHFLCLKAKLNFIPDSKCSYRMTVTMQY